MTADVFGTGALRDRVLGTWQVDPARLREDANTEEDHARGYYRDRVVVELAQNAADAAARAGTPGRLLLRLTADPEGDGSGREPAVGGHAGTDAAADESSDGRPVATLLAANTGAPLDAAAVASLAAMRASTSRDRPPTGGGPGPVGRFGVGFAAVRAVADEVRVASTTGAVRFSLDRTARDLAAAAEGRRVLAAEVDRRGGSLPALRLPYPDDARPPEGYDTAVLLALRDDDAVRAVRAMLAAVDDTLLLALPGLTEVVVEDDAAGHRRRVADVDRRWRRVTAHGELDPALVADRPVEERDRRAWRLTWALPRTGALPPGLRVVHAPTPTDDPLDLPALLVATLPLDPTRRHVVPGPATDALLDTAADLYARLAEAVARDGEDALRLVPTGLAAGALDAALRGRLTARLAAAPLLPAAGATPPDDGTGAPGRHDDALVAPERAVALAGADVAGLTRALAPWFAGLVVLPPGGTAAARALGVELRDVADVVDELPAADGLPPDRWRGLYAALAPAAGDPLVREALAALPVPLADGRVVRGARGLLLPVVDGDRGGEVARAVGVLARWGLRLVHPAAAHDLLERLGASPADPGALLDHPAVRRAVLDQADEDDLDVAHEVSDAVLALVAAAAGDADRADADPAGAAGDAPVDPARAVLGLLTLTAADGEPAPAHGLVLPGSRAERLLDPRVLAPVADAVVARWGPATLAAAGVRADLVAVRVPDVVAGADAVAWADQDDPGELVADGLDGWDEYRDALADALGEGATVPEVVAVSDLDAVRPEAWADVLARLAEPGPLRRALTEPVRAADAPGSAPGYPAWWLRTRSGLGLDRPFAATAAEPVVHRLLPPAPPEVAGLDGSVQRALGGVTALADVPAGAWEGVLRAAAGAPGGLEAELAVAVWAAWSRVAGEPGGVEGTGARVGPLDVVPALVAPDRAALVAADDAAVAPSPMWWQRTDVAALVPAPPPADPADLADLLDLPLATDLADGLVDEAEDAGGLTPTPPGVRLVLPGAPATWVEHERLHVDGAPVDWWVEGSGATAVVHATHLAGLARGLAQAAGAWEHRHRVELVLTEPARAAELALEQAGDGA